MGSRALVYYFTTTIVAAMIGITCVLLIKPGSKSIKEVLGDGGESTVVSTVDAFLDLIRFEYTIRHYYFYRLLTLL